MPADPPPPSGPSSRSAPAAAGWGRPPAGPTPAAAAAGPRSPPATPCSRACSAIRPRRPACSGCAASTSGPAPRACRRLRRTGSSTASPARPRVGRRARRPGRGPRGSRTPSRRCCWPPRATPTSPSRAGTSAHPPAGLRTYEERLLAPYADYPAPIYGVPGSGDWHDGLAGFMTVFCDAPPDARAAAARRDRARVGAGGAPHVLAAVADRHRRGARRRPLVPRHRRPVRGPARPVLRGRRRGRCGSCWSTPG